MTDPYWSMWGKLKGQRFRAERRAQMLDEADLEAGGVGEEFALEAYRESEEREQPIRLPIRRVEMTLAGMTLQWMAPTGSAEKTVRNDAHAAATLRKLDTDDAYWLSAGGTTTNQQPQADQPRP